MFPIDYEPSPFYLEKLLFCVKIFVFRLILSLIILLVFMQLKYEAVKSVPVHVKAVLETFVMLLRND